MLSSFLSKKNRKKKFFYGNFFSVSRFYNSRRRTSLQVAQYCKKIDFFRQKHLKEESLKFSAIKFYDCSVFKMC